ncbi:MAG TPA: hypothetical protein DDX39_11600 [Bacteroidales bacterium]|nr:MAG: hypothetical protein A2W98_14195 [Bacteroidetes bacterium GWF2_33_38]HBF89275.1 hypothetical protein [Bacteroidales bacterium]
MKFNNLIIFILIVLFFSCTKDDGEHYGFMADSTEFEEKKHCTYEGVLYGGCFVEEGYTNSENDTNYISYQISNDTLIFKLNVFVNCAYELMDSVSINKDTINIYLKNTSGAIAYCNCDYKYSFFFTNYYDSHLFQVYYKPYNASNYSFWTELSYP